VPSAWVCDALELPIYALPLRTERAHRTSADEGFQARRIGTSPSVLLPGVRPCALGGSLDTAVEDGESDMTRQRYRERRMKGRGEAIWSRPDQMMTGVSQSVSSPSEVRDRHMGTWQSRGC
jgi:hypothetical protein